MTKPHRVSLIDDFYAQYLVDQDGAAFVDRVSSRYTLGTIERLASHGQRMSRRAAVLALGLCGDFSSNDVVGRSLVDGDAGVRLIAAGSIRSLWCRWGNAGHRRRLATVLRMNEARRFPEAVRYASRLVDTAPEFAEAWNQRALANFSLGKYTESIPDCRQTLSLNPFHFGAASGMAHCHLQLHDPRSALECFERALQIHPGLEAVRAQVQHLQQALNKRR